MLVVCVALSIDSSIVKFALCSRKNKSAFENLDKGEQAGVKGIKNAFLRVV